MLECVRARVADISGSSFHTTAWSLVLAAAGNPTPDSRRAMAALCQTYWIPVYGFIRRCGHTSDQAQDLTQGFFALLLEKRFLQDVDRQRGRFRSFLLAAVKHFLANEWDRAHAFKRGGGQTPVSIDLMEAEAGYVPGAVDAMTPDRLFERRWALSVLDHVMARLRADYSARGKLDQFDRLEVLLTKDADADSEAIAEELGVSAGALRMSLHRLRRKYREILREEIAGTVPTPADIDDEIRFLMSVL